MFNMGFSEMLILGVLALLLIGPKQLPEAARALGRLMNEFKRATGDITSVVTDFRQESQKVLVDLENETMKPVKSADESGATETPPEKREEST